MEQSQLFETRTPKDILAEQEQRVDAQLMDVLCGRATFPISSRQRDLLLILRYRRGLRHSIQIGDLAEKLKTTPRLIKEDISDLSVRFRLPIGASRDANVGGYYLAITREDRVATATPHIHQALAHLRRARVMLDEQEMLQLMGQLTFEGVSNG